MLAGRSSTCLRSRSAEREARIVPSIPIKRVGKVQENAEAVARLLSPAASYVTSTIAAVLGGR
jgi:glucose 1-dehydrogenase